MHKENLFSNSVSLYPFPDCIDLNVRLYTKVVDSIDRKEIYIFGEPGS